MENSKVNITLKITSNDKNFYMIFFNEEQFEELLHKLSEILNISIESMTNKCTAILQYNSINPLFENEFKNGALIQVNEDNSLTVLKDEDVVEDEDKKEDKDEEILECKVIYSEEKQKKGNKIYYYDNESEFNINLNFFNENNLINDDDNDVQISELNGILKLCLLKFIAKFFKNENLEKIESKQLKKILKNLQDEIELKESIKENIKSSLSDKSGNNIIEYAKYINEVITKKDIDSLINILSDEKEEINKYWKSLSKYKSYNEFFEKEISKHLKSTIFDYSVISLILINKSKLKTYEESKKKCPNIVQKFLYHGSQIDPISTIMTTEFKYTKKAFYGMGIYFTDMLDYAGFYSGGKSFKDRRENFKKILPVKSNFSVIAAEIFYDNKKFKQIFDYSYYVKSLKFFPSYNDLIKNYKEKMVEDNGVHYVEVEANKGNYLDMNKINNFKKEGKFIGTEYVITEKKQILPLYCLTLKRNEYFILWRDPNFEGQNEFSKFLKDRKIFANRIAKMNIFFESKTEEALKLIENKKYNKIILITSIGKDLSGKKYIEFARKILTSNVICLFFSRTKSNLDWIKKFPNALYTNSSTFYEKFITDFNEEGLKSLKKSIEKEYNVNLPEFTEDFIKFPLFKKEGYYDELTLSSKYEFFRHIKLFNVGSECYIGIKNNNNNGELIISKDEKEVSVWDVTIIDGEITLYSNGYYLSNPKYDDFVAINELMESWGLFVMDDGYVIIKKGERMLNLEENLDGNYVINLKESGANYIFKMIDV